jgi:hypothetical protein
MALVGVLMHGTSRFDSTLVHLVLIQLCWGVSFAYFVGHGWHVTTGTGANSRCIAMLLVTLAVFSDHLPLSS